MDRADDYTRRLSSSRILLEAPGLQVGAVKPKAALGTRPSIIVDRAIFGPSHLLIKSSGFDPEGIVSTLTAIATFLHRKKMSIRL